MRLIFDEYNAYWVWIDDTADGNELSPQFDTEYDAIQWQQKMKRIFTGKK